MSTPDQLLATQDWTKFPIFPGNQYKTTYLGPGTDTPHFADDVQTPFHTPITALLSGTVKTADFPAWGGEVFIQPDIGGPQYYYYHLDTENVKVGQHVDKGQLVGLSGGQNSGGQHPVSTAWSSGPHTHVGYFTKFVTTQCDSGLCGRPYGPDITPLLKQGAPLTSGDTPLVSNVTNSSGQTGSWYCNIPVVGGYLCPGQGMTGQDFVYRLAFGVVGGLLIWLGLRHFLGGQKININLPQLPQAEDKTEDYQASVAKEQGEKQKAEEKATKERERKSGYDLSKEKKAPPPTGMKRGR